MPKIHSTAKRKQAIILRSEGKSLREVAKELNISLSTAQFWVKDVSLTEDQRQSIKDRHQSKLSAGRSEFIRVQKERKNELETKIFLQAINEVRIRKSDPFFMLGLALYWAEGFKKDHALGFVNSDPVMIKTWFEWLKVYGKISVHNVRLRVQINEIYKNEISATQLFWSKLIEIPIDQFQIPIFQKSKIQYNTLDSHYRGLLRIRVVGARNLFVTILGWLEGLKMLHS